MDNHFDEFSTIVPVLEWTEKSLIQYFCSEGVKASEKIHDDGESNKAINLWNKSRPTQYIPVGVNAFKKLNL